jgi:hypothetical protein
MLLLGAAGMAMTAVSGCVSVSPDRPPAHGSRPDPGQSGRSGQGVRPQVVQAPLREALEIAQPPSPSADAPEGTAHRTAAPPPRHRTEQDPLAQGRVTEQHGLGRHQDGTGAESRGHGRSADRNGPRTGRPAPGTVPADPARLCALGETYGKWPADSPQARICHATYGH